MSKKDNIKRTRKEYRERNAKLRELGYETYNDYLESDRWKEKRKQKKRMPCVCGEKNHLELHHKTYRRVGNERLKDLVWLCRVCHEKLHDSVSKGKYSLKHGMKCLQVKKKSKKRKVDVNYVKNSSKYISEYKGVRVRKRRISKKQKKYDEYRAKEAKKVFDANLASQKYKIAFREWLANKDYTVPKPTIEQFLNNL